MMELFKEDGDVKGYVPPGFLMDGYSMFFSFKDKVTLQLNVTGSAVADMSSGINSENVHSWLWEVGKDMLEQGHVKESENITIVSYDVKNRELITPYNRLRRDPK